VALREDACATWLIQIDPLRNWEDWTFKFRRDRFMVAGFGGMGNQFGNPRRFSLAGQNGGEDGDDRDDDEEFN
jgi:hypothetical protein